MGFEFGLWSVIKPLLTALNELTASYPRGMACVVGPVGVARGLFTHTERKVTLQETQYLSLTLRPCTISV